MADIKADIETTVKELAKENGRPAIDKHEVLTLLYLKDQNQEKAFETFLAGLIPPTKLSQLPKEVLEEKVFLEALEYYLDHHSTKSTKDVAEYIISTYQPKLKEAEKPYLFEYLVALSYANLGNYEKFVSHFYHIYKYYPDHFLAYKTKAIVHIKLLERRSMVESRELERKAVINNLEEALKRDLRDIALFRLLISFSSPEDKSGQIRHCLNKIITDNIIIPRKDIQIYVQEAVNGGEKMLAQRFVDKAKEWYPNSRILKTAQEYLDSQK